MEKIKKIKFFPASADVENIFPGKTISEPRKRQSGTRYRESRPLTHSEIEALERGGCFSENWKTISVKDPFDPSLVKNCTFEGVVRIGALENGFLFDGERNYRCGFTSSRIISSDFGDYCAIHNNSMVSAVITGNYVVFADNNEIYTTENARFGNSIPKKGDTWKTPGKINIVNERGGRGVLFFSGMRGEDIYFWIKNIADTGLAGKLEEFTFASRDSEPGYYSFFDDHTAITGTSLVRNTMTGRSSRIRRACRVDEVTINSTASNPSVVRDNAIVERGIIGEGCRIESSSIASDFMLAPNSSLSLGARFIHSYLGSCSAVSCCEVQSSFIYPCHQQHHNNSFLIASVVMGQSNVAAGATLGSNHNGRMNDCEMWAGRGFWPGLCSSVRFNSKFASFCLLAKSDFPYELNIRLPFSLVNNNGAENCLEIIPAYWWLYNMYALFRNFFKFRERSSGTDSMKGVELSFMAPDTAEEVLEGLKLIEERRLKAKSIETEFRSINIELPAEGIEGSDRIVRVLRVDKARSAYREMLLFYCGSVIFEFVSASKGNLDLLLRGSFSREREKKWANMCGCLVPEKSLKEIIAAVRKPGGKISSWEEVHDAFDREHELYYARKLSHAAAVALELYDEQQLDLGMLEKLKADYTDVLHKVEKEIVKSRNKDYESLIRLALFSGRDEMEAVIGEAGKDLVVKEFKRFFIDTLPRLS